ncbi:MAG TPA: AAC(3) family N-acetyltransferase [Gemmatimonadales bacterium]|nr:AAC(3) family N-acetyltransferase [Gemmatimonadales bacterium]
MSSPASVAEQLAHLGVRPGSVLVVHSAFSRVGPMEGGPDGLVAALEIVLGPQGTLVMPSMTEDDDHVFDPRATPCRHLGVVPDRFWRHPGVLRGDTPHAFAAKGPAAAEIVRPQPVDIPHGPDSPVGRVHQMDGWVLLIGVGHDANTTIHLAEALAEVPYRLPKHATVLRDGRPETVRYLEIDHCCQRFALADQWMDAGRCQRRGWVGKAEARLMRSRDLVDVVVSHLRQDPLLFLHPPGVDAECDQARQSCAHGPAGAA